MTLTMSSVLGGTAVLHKVVLLMFRKEYSITQSYVTCSLHDSAVFYIDLLIDY